MPISSPAAHQPLRQRARRPRSASDRPTDDCGTARAPRRRRSRPRGRPRADARCWRRACRPTATRRPQDTRCLVSSRTTPNCSTGRAPNCGSRNSAIVARLDELRPLAPRPAAASAGPARPPRATARRARAPMPGTRRRSSCVARVRPCRPPTAVEHRVGELERARAARRRARARSRAARCRRARPRRRARAFRAADRAAQRSSSYIILLLYFAADASVACSPSRAARWPSRGCSEPPQKEIDQAQAALDRAARAPAPTGYAADEFTAAASRAPEGARGGRPARLPPGPQLRARRPPARAGRQPPGRRRTASARSRRSRRSTARSRRAPTSSSRSCARRTPRARRRRSSPRRARRSPRRAPSCKKRAQRLRWGISSRDRNRSPDTRKARRRHQGRGEDSATSGPAGGRGASSATVTRSTRTVCRLSK